ADLVLMTPEGYILIDHKSFRGGRDQVEAKAREYAGQLALYKEMLEQATGEKVLGTFIYFGVSGWVVEVGGIE
ncbi:MAG: hypothetical protein ABEH43_05780, partial [Flavobacteriales bacterium]